MNTIDMNESSDRVAPFWNDETVPEDPETQSFDRWNGGFIVATSQDLDRIKNIIPVIPIDSGRDRNDNRGVLCNDDTLVKMRSEPRKYHVYSYVKDEGDRVSRLFTRMPLHVQDRDYKLYDAGTIVLYIRTGCPDALVVGSKVSIE